MVADPASAARLIIDRLIEGKLAVGTAADVQFLDLNGTIGHIDRPTGKPYTSGSWRRLGPEGHRHDGKLQSTYSAFFNSSCSCRTIGKGRPEHPYWGDNKPDFTRPSRALHAAFTLMDPGCMHAEP